jgi:signal peptidase I
MEVCPPDFQSLLEQLLGSGVSVRFAARGGSMAPGILHGEIVVVAPIGDDAIQPGEIVLVASKVEGLMVHRVIEVLGCGPGMRIVTKGDASQSADRPTGRDEILGKVIRIEGGAPLSQRVP